jgi:hypothetical protein
MMWLQVHAPILFVITLLPFTTAVVALAISTLPIAVSWPHNLTELAAIGRELNTYTQSGWGATWHVIAVVAISAVWKHAWSIPGSVLWVCHVICSDWFISLISVFRMFLLAPCSHQHLQPSS